jgi:hypothetical protein
LKDEKTDLIQRTWRSFIVIVGGVLGSLSSGFAFLVSCLRILIPLEQHFKILVMNQLRRIQIIFAIAAGLLQPSVLAAPPSGDLPESFYSSGDLRLESGRSSEVFGPLYHQRRSDSLFELTVSPLFSYRSDPVAESKEWELVYPLMTFHQFGAERRLQFLQVLSLAGGQTLKDEDTRRVTIFPFYFEQRSTDPELEYRALFPFYGRLRGRLFRDEVQFALFPAYLKTRKRDVETRNILFPLFHRRTGPGLSGVQLWPLFGVESRAPSVRTNIVDELETMAGHEKFFVLWPLFFKNKTGIGTENPETTDILLPFYSLQRSPSRDSATYLWPFGLSVIEDRGKQYREWGFPWPLITFARGEGKTSNRVWPLFSRSRTETLESGFALWPLYKYNRATTEDLDRTRRRVLWFLYSDLVERNLGAGTAFERTDLWPLFSARRNHDGTGRFQVLALLEPFLPASLDVERIYSPLWTVWSSETDPNSGVTKSALLWNLFRSERTGNSRKCSLLFGFFHYQSGPEGSSWRMFSNPFGKNRTRKEPDAPADSTANVSKHR